MPSRWTDENPLTLRDGLALVAGKVNESKTAKIAAAGAES